MVRTIMRFSLLLIQVLLVACGSSQPASKAPANSYLGDAIVKSPLIDISWFGAKGDGVTDSGPAIQRAIDYAAANGGGTVFVPAGTFRLATMTDSYYLLKIKDKVSVKGEGPASILKAGNCMRDASHGISILYNHEELISDWSISDLTIDYNGINNLLLSGYGPYANVNRTGANISSGGTIRNVRFKNSAGHHFIWFGLASEDARNDRNSVIDCTFEECGLSIAGNQATDHSSIYMGSTNSIVTGNVFKNRTQDYVASAIELHGNNTVATGNTVVKYNHGLNLGGDSNSVSNISITGNTFRSVVRGVVPWTLSNYTIDRLVVADNTITLTDTEGTPFAPGGGIVYSGNFDTSAATSSSWSITGNTIHPESVYTITQAYTITGIEIDPVAGLYISRNVISGTKAEGIRVASVTGKAPSNVIISDNIATSCGYTSTAGRRQAIYLASNSSGTIATNVVASGNSLTSGHYGAGIDMDYGISLNGGGQFDRLTLADNAIYGASIADINTPTSQTGTN